MLYPESGQINQRSDPDCKSVLLCKKLACLLAVLVSQCSGVWDSCMHPVLAVICRSFGCAGKLQRPAFLWIWWDLQTPGTRVQTDAQQRQADPAFLAVIKENSTKLIFQLCDFLNTVVMAFLDECSAGRMCVFSFQRYFLRSCFCVSACSSFPGVHVVSQ